MKPFRKPLNVALHFGSCGLVEGQAPDVSELTKFESGQQQQKAHKLIPLVIHKSKADPV